LAPITPATYSKLDSTPLAAREPILRWRQEAPRRRFLDTTPRVVVNLSFSDDTELQKTRVTTSGLRLFGGAPLYAAQALAAQIFTGEW
jgi:hypothetical protein